MTRTKQTARRTGAGPGLAEAAATADVTSAGRSKSRKGKPQHIFKQRAKRVSANINALQEIRRAQKVTTLCILKAPFRRLVREVSEECKDDCKWYSTALDCLQCAAEDYLIEYFIDAILLAAHAGRVTLMIKDTTTLGMLRHRMNMLVHPVDFVDKKMKDILMVPPARRPKERMVITEVKEDDIHDKDTRANAVRKELFEKQDVSKKKKRIETQNERNVKGRIELEQENFNVREEFLCSAIQRLRPLAKVLLQEEEDLYLREMVDEDLYILQNPIKEVSDNVLFIALR